MLCFAMPAGFVATFCKLLGKLASSRATVCNFSF